MLSTPEEHVGLSGSWENIPPGCNRNYNFKNYHSTSVRTRLGCLSHYQGPPDYDEFDFIFISIHMESEGEKLKLQILATSLHQAAQHSNENN
jgi:hypothetical protein